MLQAAQGRKPAADLQHNSVTGFPCKSLDFYQPPSLCQRSPYIFQGSHYIFHAHLSLTRGFEMKMVTPVACFAAGNRKIFKQESAALDVAHRKLLRRVVGPLAGLDWSRPWHEILHEWNVRVSIFVGQPWLETLVTHMSRTTFEIWSLCGELTL